MRKAKQAVVASAVGVAVLATPLALPNLGGSTGSAEDAEVGGDVTVDPVAIGQAIADAAKTADNRSGFVKGAMEKAFFESGQQYNVMVMNLSQEYNSDQLRGVQYFDTVDYDGITYGYLKKEHSLMKVMEAMITGPSEVGLNAQEMTRKRSIFIDLN